MSQNTPAVWNSTDLSLRRANSYHSIFLDLLEQKCDKQDPQFIKKGQATFLGSQGTCKTQAPEAFEMEGLWEERGSQLKVNYMHNMQQ